MDSTGVAVIPKVGEVCITKELGNPYQLFDHRSFDKALIGSNRVLIGHNRYATQGKISRVNAHPFDFDSLVGVHNGTLINKWGLVDSRDFDVDSENLYHSINKVGLKESLSKVGGAWSLVWWDKFMSSLNFLRNKERPMFMCRSSDGGVLFWASEEWMLEGVLSRNGVKHGEIISTEEDMLYSIGIDNKGVMEKAHISHNPSTYVPYNYNNKYFGTQNTKPTLVVNNKDKEEKKAGVVPQIANPPLLSGPVSYNPSGHQRLTIVGHGRDQFGSTYFSCLDCKNNSVPIRLYFTRLPVKVGSPDDAIGGTFLGVVNPKPSTTVKSTYYKVIVNSVNWDDFEPFDDDEITGVITEAYDHHHNVMDIEKWTKKYGNCAWCNGEVFPDKKHALTDKGDSLCEDCCDNKEVIGYVGYGAIRNA